jgi:uncharacterized protein (DUF433 family)
VYWVAYGSGWAGVKMRVVVPDQRKVPLTAGLIRKNGAVTGCGILPRTTIGSEKTAWISLASASVAVSPTGPALTMRSVLAAKEGVASSRKKRSAATLFLMTPRSVRPGPPFRVSGFALCGARIVANVGRSFSAGIAKMIPQMDYHDIITVEPDKRGGQPCIRGLRITVFDVLSYLASGMTEEEILSDYPDLTHEDILASLSYAADRERKTVVSSR